MKHRVLVSMTAAVSIAFIASPSVAAAAAATRAAIVATPSSATIYRKVALTGTFKTYSGAPIAGLTVRLESYAAGAWRRVKDIRTNARGQAVASVQPPGDTKYRYRYLGSSRYRPSASSMRTVGGYTVPNQTWSGAGDSVVGPFTLESGLAVFDLACGTTDANFIVQLADAGGEHVGLLANAIGAFAGSKALRAPTTGKYYLEVSCDTTWTITARQPRQLSAPATRGFAGSGAAASGLFQLSKAAYRFHWENTGSSNFIVMLLDRNGDYVKLIANEIGSSSGTALFPATSGQFILDVTADGPWTIVCLSP
jgi:hypothetical protein